MSKKVDLHDVAQITIGNVLNNYQRSSKALQELLGKALDKIDFDRYKTKKRLRNALREARKVFPLLASIDESANQWFLDAISTLRKQLDEPYEVVAYTKDCIRNVEDALDNAIMKTFANKERISSFMMAHVSTKGTELDWSSVVMPQAMKALERMNEEMDDE